MAHQETQEWLYNQLKSRGCTVGKDFNEFVNTVCADSASRDWLYNKAKGYRLGVGTREQFESWIAPEATTATPPAAPAASSSAPTAPAKVAASSSASASPHDSQQAVSGTPAQLGSSAATEPQRGGTELLADFAAAMQGDWRDSLGTQAREAVAGMDALAAQSQQLAAPTHISTDSGLPALDAMAEQWNAEADQRHGALQRRLDSPGRYMIGAPQRTTTSAVEDAMGAMMSGNSRPVVLGISGMPQGGGQAAGGQDTSGSLAQAAVGPRPAGYTRNENGEMVPQWELPDGTLTTSFMTVEDAQYQANQARGIMEQERKRESALHQATVAADKAIEDEIGAYAAEQRRGNDVNLWDINPDTGVNIAGVNRYFDIEGQRARLYEGMGERIYNLLPADVRQSELANYQQYFASHPQEIPQGMTAAQAAEQSLRGWCDQQAYSYLVGKQAPQGSLEFLGRKIVELNPAFPQMWSQLNAARQGNATLAVADQQAMSDYGAKHRALDITGTVLNMAADPLNFVGGGAASMVGKGVARAVFRKTGTNLAARLMTSRLGTSMIQGAAHGATAFAIYEGGKSIERQLTTNNYNFETGQFQGFSWGDVGSSMRHGAIMGAATGWIAPIVGNTSSKLAAGVSSTGAKAATRAGVHAVGIGVEAGIFSTASYFESGQFDFWDNLAFIVGMKASHGGRRTVSEVLGAALNRNKPFGEWIRERVSRDSREYQFTDGELAEMREAGYGRLSALFARAGRSKASEADGAEILQSVSEREYDGYDNVRRLMSDNQVSQATRAKVYWWLTGRKLPMSTILSAEMVTEEDGNIVVTAYTNGGEVVLRERFKGKDASKARQLYDTYNAQVESNLIEFGEQVRNRDSASDNQLGVVFSSVAEKLNVTNTGVAVVFEKMMRGTAISEFTASERLVGKEIMARLGGLQRITDAELSFGEGTSNILKYMVSEMAGVDVEAALKKGAPARSEAEQRAVDMYIDALYSQNARAARSRQLSGTKIEGDEAQAPADEAQPIEVAQAAEEARPAEEYAPKYRAGNILVGEGENARWLVLTGRENPEYQGLYEVYDPETKEVSYYTESELDEVVKEYVEFDTVAPSEAEVEAMAHSRDGEEAGEVPEGAIRIDQPAEEVPAEVPEGAIRIDRPEGEGEKSVAEVPAAEAPRAEAAEVPAEAPVTEAPAVETTAEEAPKTEAPAAASESALARIPVAEDGAPIFTAVDAPTAWAGLREFFGDTQAALDYATNMINAAQKRADKASKTSVPFSENPLKYRENLQKVREAVGKANAELAQWQAIAAEAQRAQEAVEMQQNAEAAAERGVVAFQPTGTVKERWDNSEKVYGLQSVIVLPDSTRVRGRYVLSHVDAATASHQPANSFARSEGFPVNENGTTINDRDYEHDKAAQEQVRKTASAYDRRALLDMPVVQDGVVLSGNERTMAAQLAARQGTNADYIAGMKESVDGKTNRWGIPLADVERFGANAAIRFEVEEVLGEGDAPQGKFPLNTKTMRRFNVKATKDQSKTEKTITFAKAMSDHTYNQLTRVVFGAGETLSDFYGKRAAVLEALNLLVEQGEITDREMPKYWDDVKGQITEEGKDLIENALLGKYFADNEQVVRVLAGMGMVRTAVVAALPELSRNAQFRTAGYDLQKEVAEAILFIKKVKDSGAFKSGVPVSGFNLQNDFFDGEFGDTKVSHVSVLMIADLLNDKRTNRFREVLSDYNDFANGPANGQIDAFEGRPLTREEVLRPIIDKIQTDYNANYGRARITEPAEAGERKQPTEVEQAGRTEQPAERAEAVTEAEDALEGDAKEQVVEGDKSPSPETKTSGGKVEPPAEKPAEAVIEKPAAETEKAEESQAEAPNAEEQTEAPVTEQVNEIAERVNRGIDEYTNMLYTYLSVPEGEEIPAQFIEQFDAMSKSLFKDLVDYFKSQGNTEDEAVARARDAMERVRAEATAAIASRSREGMVPEQPAVRESVEKPAEVTATERPKAEAEAKPAKVAKPKPQPKAEPAKPKPKVEPAKPQPEAEPAKPEAVETAKKPAKKAVAKKPVAKEAAPAKLEDFGEKILGARKDALKELSKSLDNANAQSFVALPLTKAFSRPNVKKLVESGVLNESEALLVEAVSVMILGSRKPSVSRTNLGRFKLERWAAQMQECAQLLKKFVEGDAEVRKVIMDALRAEYEQCKESGGQISSMGFAFAVLERAGLGDMSGYKPVTMDVHKLGGQYFISVSKGRARVIGNSLEEAVSVQAAALQIKNGVSDVELPMSAFKVEGAARKFVGTGKWIVTVFYGKRGASYRQEFSSREEAEAYMAKNPESRMREESRFEGYEHFVIECRNPLNGERVEVDFGTKFGSESEAKSYIEEHLSELSAKAVDKIFAEEKVERKPKQYYFVSKDYETGEYFVHYDIWIHSIHKTREEAVEAANKLNEEYAALVEKGRKITYFSTDERPRVGRDWRGGRDATPEMFTEAFAFRGVQFGNWTNGRDRQEALNQAYDAFMDLAEVLGKSPKAMSLNGELGLAFGARGSGAASAHYEPEQVVINLTKTKGAGSLAHEWWHALDNYFARSGGIANGFATESNQVLRGELASDVRNLLQAIDKSAYGKRCARMSAYWRSTIEVTARLFAEYVSAKIHRRNGENSFLSRGVDMKELQKLKHNNWLLYLMRVSKRAKTYYGKVKPVTPMTMEEFMRSEDALAGFPYPTAEEVNELEPYLDKFVGDIREDEGGAMYQKVGRVAEVGDVVRVADEGDVVLVDALAERMSSSGIEVVRDGAEGQRVLDDANGGVRMDFAASEEEFERRHRMAVEQRGVVAAGLGQMSVAVVDVPRHDFAGTFKEAVNAAEGWARANLTGREYTYGKNGGRYSISGNAVEKFLSQSAMKPSENAGVHLSALKYLPQIIEQSIDVEIHPDYVKGENSLRAVENGIGRGDVLVHRLYGCINIDGQLYRVKTTMYEYRRTSEQKKNTPHSYEVTKIELLEAPWWNDHQHAAMTSSNSISGAKLLQNVEKSYEKGKKVLDESRKNGAQLHKVYHGSGTDFDAFDFGHMGEGEGAQAFGWGGYVTEVEGIGRTYAHQKEDTSGMMLYTIDIPQDDGRNYLHWEKTVGENAAREVRERLYEHLIRTDEEGLYGDAISRKELERELAAAFSGDMVGADLYGTVSSYLGSDKAASEFLRGIGFVGVSYPAQYFSGGRKDMARNYVIFRESDMLITDKVRFFRTKDGEAYGFTVGGKIYIDPRYVNAETPIHEYTHLWAEALRRGNAEEWRNVIELMRGTSIWDEVREQYPELKTEDEIAEEVLAQYSGRRGAERLREEMRKAAHGEGTTMDKARAVSVLERVRLALERFWRSVADFLHVHFTSAEEVADRVLADLLNGVNPLRSVEERAIVERAKADGTYMKAPNGRPTKLSERQWVQVRTKAFKEWFGDWENNPESASKVLDENGEPMVMWHETGNVFTTFNPRRAGAGASDYMTPFGIFLKDSSAPIGVARGGDVNQMALFVKMQNPIEFANREEMESYLRSKCEGYAQLSDSIKNIDAEYGKKYDDAEKAENDAMMDIYLNHPEIWNDEARRDGAVEKYSSEVDRILKEWQGAEGRMSAELKELTDRFFRGSGHDGIILKTDEGSFGRKTRTNIVFNPNQVKSATENVGTFDGGNADIRYQFIGERGAAAADRAEEASVRLDNLAVAREMEAAGKDALAVKMATGWERGADGKWRYEVPDVEDNLIKKHFDKNSLTIYDYRIIGLEELLGKDNFLFRVYPELKAIDVKVEKRGYEGEYDARRKRITVPLNDSGNIFAHELQHAIQDIEGFAKGGSTLAVTAQMQEETRDKILNKLKKLAAENGYTVSEIIDNPKMVSNNAELADVLNKYKNILEKGARYYAYARLGGEVEARNVQARMGMSAEERRRTLAEASEDVAREDQVILYESLGGLGNAQSTMHNAELGGAEAPAPETKRGDAISESVEAINARFNRELEEVANGGKGAAKIQRFDLGMPSQILLSAGFDNLPIVMRKSLLFAKAGNESHPFDVMDVKDLVLAMQEPIAIFRYTKDNMRNLIVDISKGEKQMLVGVTLNYKANEIEVNSVSGLFPKENHEWIKWIQDGKAIRIDQKEKVLSLIDSLRTNPAESIRIGLNLDSAAKVVENFENPKYLGENLSDEGVLYSLREESAPKRTGIGYKVFVLKDGKLYPPMVANPGGADTPVGVWLNADAAPVAGLTKTGRQQVKAGGKGTQGGGGKLAYRPGWHLGTIPYALQFNRLNAETGQRELFPNNFVWAEVEYSADNDYQEEAMSYGYNANGKFQHSLAGLPRLPKDGYYKYRTNPDPRTDEWIITGSMRVKRLLTPTEVDSMVMAAGREPQKRQAGAVTDEQVEALNGRMQAEQELGADAKKARAMEAASELGVEVRFIESGEVRGNGEESERQRKARGWYDTATGEVVVVLDNNADAAEAVATVYHEVVAHKGLRELVGKENMSAFLRQVYAAADESIRREIASMAARHGYNVETATEEYLARLAEKGFEDFTPKQRSLWKRLRDFIVNLLRKCLRLPKWVKLHDNELRQILYASYENLKGKSAEARGKSGVVREAALTEGLLYSDGMDLEATVTRGKINLALRNQGDRDLREQAIAAINGNLQQLRRAMRAQRNYDRSTAKSLTDLVRAMIGGKQLHGMSDYELSRLFVAIRDAVGRDDYSKQVDKVMDILIKNQLSQAEEALDKLMRIRGSKVDAKGVEVQGQLDLRGQAIVKEFKSALKLSDEDLSQAMAKAQNDLTSTNAVIADDASNKVNAYTYVSLYNTLVRDSEANEQLLRRQLAEEKKRYQAGEISKEVWEQFEAATRDAIRENQMQRVEDMRGLISQMADTLNQSIARAQAFAQAQKEHVRQIQHEANSDLQGVPYATQHPESGMQKLKNSSLVQFFARTLPSFDAIMRLLSKNSPNGEGYLWNRFMRGFVDAVEQERTMYLQAKATLDKQVQIIFGPKMTWDKLARAARKMKLADGRRTMAVTIHDGGAQRQIELTSGELMYLYMANKMTDGEMKLRKMGIMESDIAAIEQLLDARLVELADWLQDVFFVDMREQYNEVHKRMFGASMAAIDNYVPLKILDTAIQKQEDIAAPDMDNKRSATTTGSIIKRTVNVLPIDLMHCNIFEVVNNHVQEMNHWAAFAELSRDLNTLLSYNLFKNRVRNMESVLGSGNLLLKQLQVVSAIMTGNYRPNATRPDKWAVNIARGWTITRVLGRIFTSWKQLASMPAFLSEARPDYLMANLLTWWRAFNWCLKNLPMFEKRWMGRMAGNEKLMPTDLDWNIWRKQVIAKIERWGLTPNGFVDALTVAIGAYSIYQTRVKRYIRDGYTQADAEKRARQDANILVNKSQQSSEGAFLSEMQVARSWWSVMFTAFRNSPISYQRMALESWRNIGRRLRGDKSEGIAFLKKQLLRQWGFEVDSDGKASGPEYNGMDAETAEGMAGAAAKREYRRSWMRDIMNAGVYGFVMQLFWNLFSKGLLLTIGSLLFSGDDDENKQIIQDETVHALIGGMVEGLTGGEVISDGLTAMANAQINGTEADVKIEKSMPITQDIEQIGDLYGVDEIAATNELVNVLMATGISFNPQLITDTALAIYDACQGDMETMQEVTFCLMRIFQVPQSQLDKMYFDELGCTGAEARRMSPAQVAERYAQYKVMRSGGLMQWMYSDELYNRRVSAYRKRAMTILKGKMPGLWSDSVNESYEQALATTQRMRSATREERYDGRFSEADFATYRLFPKLDRNFRHISEAYLNAETPQDANRYMDALIEYKPLMMEVLNASDEAECERLYEQLITRYNELNIEEK